jgi:hypothetical protein
VNDGEPGKRGFARYVVERVSDCSGANPEPRVIADQAAFPEYAAIQALIATSRRR